MSSRYIETVIKTTAMATNPHVDAVAETILAHGGKFIGQYRGARDHETHYALIVTQIDGNRDLRGEAGDRLVVALKALPLPVTATVKDVLRPWNA